MQREFFRFIAIAVIGFVFSVSATAQYQQGEKVEVEERGKWYPATVLEVKSNSWFIHYEGYSSSYDEWLGSTRIRPIASSASSQSTSTASTASKASKASTNTSQGSTLFSPPAKSGSMNSSLKEEFRKDYGKYFEAVEAFATLYNPNLVSGNISGMYAPPEDPSIFKDYLQQLEQFHTLIQQKYQGVYDDENSDQIDRLPGTIVRIVQYRKEIAVLIAKQRTKKVLESILKDFSSEKTAEELKPQRVYDPAGTYYAELYPDAKYAKVFGILSTPLTTVLITGGSLNKLIMNKAKKLPEFVQVAQPFTKESIIDEVAESYESTIQQSLKQLSEECKRSIPKLEFVTTYKDAGGESAAKRSVLASCPQASILQIGMMSPNWTVRKNSIGIPTHRVKLGGAYFKDPVTKQSKYASFVYRQQYQGGSYDSGAISDYVEYFVQ